MMDTIRVLLAVAKSAGSGRVGASLRRFGALAVCAGCVGGRMANLQRPVCKDKYYELFRGKGGEEIDDEAVTGSSSAAGGGGRPES